MIRYAVGVDLALLSDHTAITVLERTTEPGPDPTSWLTMHLERMPKGTPHPEIIDHLVDILGRLTGSAGPAPVKRSEQRMTRRRMLSVAVDATGAGNPILADMRVAIPEAVGVTITGGQNLAGTTTEPHVPKADLVAAAQVALERGHLKIRQQLADAATLVDELLAYEARPTLAGNITYNARDGEHDDLLLSLCLALWIGNRDTQRSRARVSTPAGRTIGDPARMWRNNQGTGFNDLFR